MKINRRAAIAGAAALSAASPARAQEFPTKAIKIVVPFAAGSATDLTARGLGAKLQDILKQAIVIDNKPGASGQLGASAVATAPADGYTLLMGTNSTNAANTALFKKLSYDMEKDFAPIANCVSGVNALVVNNDVPVKTVAELIDYAKKNPGKLAYGSAGLGTYSQMRIEMLKMRAGIDILHVPYRGSADAMNDLLAGNVQLMNEINVIPHVRAGKLKLLNINYSTRHPDFPDVPTLTEQGYPDTDLSIQYTIQAPAGTPKEIINAFNQKIVEIAKTPDMIARMQSINVIVPIETPEQTAASQAKAFQENGKLIVEAKISMD